MIIAVTIEDQRWGSIGAMAERAAAAVLDHFKLDGQICDISLLACDDARIGQLNSQFRDKPGPTNVLSWPAEDLSADIDGGSPTRPEPDFSGEISLGDVAIAFDTCSREASQAGRSFDDHVTHLLVHGILHLLGYDHIRDADATLMEEIEVEILGKMGIGNPYME